MLFRSLWILLKDDRFVLALISQARKKLIWHCAELLEVYKNVAKLEWFEQILPGNSIEQLGLDIVRRLITADIERYYQIAIQERENYGELPRSNNPMDLLFCNAFIIVCGTPCITILCSTYVATLLCLWCPNPYPYSRISFIH